MEWLNKKHKNGAEFGLMNFLCTVLLHMTTFTLAMDDNPPEHEGRYKPITFVKPNGKNALQRGAKQDQTLNMMDSILTECIGRIERVLEKCEKAGKDDKYTMKTIYTQELRCDLIKVFSGRFTDYMNKDLLFLDENSETFYYIAFKDTLKVDIIRFFEMTEKAMCLQTIIHKMFRSVYNGMFPDLRFVITSKLVCMCIEITLRKNIMKYARSGRFPRNNMTVCSRN